MPLSFSFDRLDQISSYLLNLWSFSYFKVTQALRTCCTKRLNILFLVQSEVKLTWLAIRRFCEQSVLNISFSLFFVILFWNLRRADQKHIWDFSDRIPCWSICHNLMMFIQMLLCLFKNQFLQLTYILKLLLIGFHNSLKLLLLLLPFFLNYFWYLSLLKWNIPSFLIGQYPSIDIERHFRLDRNRRLILKFVLIKWLILVRNLLLVQYIAKLYFIEVVLKKALSFYWWFEQEISSWLFCVYRLVWRT